MNSLLLSGILFFWRSPFLGDATPAGEPVLLGAGWAPSLAGDTVVGAVYAQAECLAFDPPLGLCRPAVLSAVLVCAGGLCSLLGFDLSEPFLGRLAGLAVLFGNAAGVGWFRQGEAGLEGTAYRPRLRGNRHIVRRPQDLDGSIPASAGEL